MRNIPIRGLGLHSANWDVIWANSTWFAYGDYSLRIGTPSPQTGHSAYGEQHIYLYIVIYQVYLRTLLYAR